MSESCLDGGVLARCEAAGGTVGPTLPCLHQGSCSSRQSMLPTPLPEYLWQQVSSDLRVERILYIKFDYSLLPINEYLNICCLESDYQIWPSSVERTDVSAYWFTASALAHLHKQ